MKPPASNAAQRKPTAAEAAEAAVETAANKAADGTGRAIATHLEQAFLNGLAEVKAEAKKHNDNLERKVDAGARNLVDRRNTAYGLAIAVLVIAAVAYAAGAHFGF